MSAEIPVNVLLKDTHRERKEPPGEPMPWWAKGSRAYGDSPMGVALWLFIAVATSLFSLFLASYVMRMNANDWYPIAMPPQLWLSTSLLLAGSVVLQAATAAGRHAWWSRAYQLLCVGGLCAIAFLAVQLWGWQNLLAHQVKVAGNPAGSFFFLLTAMHGLHVLGGVVACVVTLQHVRAGWRNVRPVALCARYWHFLLVVWLVIFAALGWLTPEIVRAICGTR